MHHKLIISLDEIILNLDKSMSKIHVFIYIYIQFTIKVNEVDQVDDSKFLLPSIGKVGVFLALFKGWV